MALSEKQEEWMRDGSLVALWIVCLSFVATYAWLIIFLKVDIIIPLKTIIFVGFSYWMFYSLVSTVFHLYVLHLRNPLSLCLKLGSLPTSIVTALYALPSIVSLQIQIAVNAFAPYILFIYGVGAFAVVGGLFAVTYYAGAQRRLRSHLFPEQHGNVIKDKVLQDTISHRKRYILWLIWGIATLAFPFLIFLMLEAAGSGDLIQRVTIALTGAFVWIFIWMIRYILDLERDRLSEILLATQSDCIIQLWATKVTVNDDGSSIIDRIIEGINNAEERRFFEFDAYRDIHGLPTITHRSSARVTADVRTGETFLKRVFETAELAPASALNVMHESYVIPLLIDEHRPLKRGDSFIIRIEGSSPARTWKKERDFYTHRVIHVTQKLAVTINLPSQWEVDKAFIEVKGPSTAVWTRMQEIKVSREPRGGSVLTAEISNPRLFHTYRLSFSSPGHT